ncbi:MAG: septal ring lytic transglycosylase RlpA family protein [Proteobacteria bacterium]|nr:septal ring lytic transglycosylase RlpA family protein [Pseudomonadota bacterium]
MHAPRAARLAHAERALGVLLCAALGACSITGRHEPAPETRAPSSGNAPAAPAGVPPPPTDMLSTPDAVPKVEPRSRYGNPAFYDVFGKRYYVMASSLGYVERGVASWYGPGFHAVRTSTGEPYDMYGMTAAHKTLSLPTYVRVTNLENNRSIVVRVNDRGPFVGNRIIDLSYTAAAKLDMLRKGTAFVEVRAIDPLANPISTVTPVTSALLTAPGANPALTGGVSAGVPGSTTLPASGSAAPAPSATPEPTTGIVPRAGAVPGAAAPGTSPRTPSAAPIGASPAGSAPAASTPPARSGLFVQAGAFTNRANAERLASRLSAGRYGQVFVREAQSAGKPLYRVRIGPVADVPAFDRTVKALESAGIHDAHLAMD